MTGAPFTLFGPDHLAAIGGTAVGAAGFAWALRRTRGTVTETGLRVGLAGLLVGTLALYIAVAATTGIAGPERYVPLHLCDMALLVAAYALVTRRPLAVECLWFWALSGTVLAIVTPDLLGGFPHWHYFVYFLHHGGTVIAAVGLVLGAGLRPAPGATWRALALTNGYAVVIGGVNAAFGTNFLFLCRKPESATPLDAMGGWPWYLLAGEGVAVVFAIALFWPFRRGITTMR